MKLVKYNEIDEKEYDLYMSEWEKNSETIVPLASSRGDLDFEQVQKKFHDRTLETVREKGFVPATLFFLVDDFGKIFGALDLRHELNEYLALCGGHIGYGVRPSERGRGFGKKQLSLGLLKAKELGLSQVLVTCGEENVKSAKTIEACGGVYENTHVDTTDNRATKRYFFDL